jgi:hypothetical protein
MVNVLLAVVYPLNACIYDAVAAVPNSEPVNPLLAITEPVTIRLPVIIALPVNGNDEAFATYDAVVANEADVAVPNSEPVIPLVTLSEPDI